MLISYWFLWSALLALIFFSSGNSILHHSRIWVLLVSFFAISLSSVDNVLKFMISFFEKESSLFGKVGFAGAQTDLTKTINFNPLY